MKPAKALGQDLTALIHASAAAYAASGNSSATALAAQLHACSPRYAMPTAPLEPTLHPPLASLSAALANLPPNDLTPPLRAWVPQLRWIVSGSSMPASFAGRSAYVEIVGPDGITHHDELRFGLYVQIPDSLYPPHNHAAEELYYVLSGTARWQKADGEYRAMPSGTLIHHAPWERHSMQTGSEPLLALWAWLGDLDYSKYRIDDA